MGLRLFLGEAAGGKTTGIMEEIRRILDGDDHAIKRPKNGRVFLVTPEQMTLKTEEALLSYLGKEALFQVQVLSFKRLANMVFEEVGQKKVTYLDDVGKTMILYKILKEHQSELQYYGRSIQKAGFISQLKLMITEIIQYHLEEEALAELAKSQSEESILRLKLSDIALIWHYFQEELEQKEGTVMASEMLLDVFASRIPDSQKLAGSYVYLDGFTGFTPQQYRILRELLLTADEVTVTLTMPKAAYDSAMKVRIWPELRRDVFFTPSKTLVKLLEMSADLHTKLTTTWFTEGLAHRDPELVHVTRHLCLTDNNTYSERAQRVKAHTFDSIQKEIQAVMHLIVSLTREEGYRYKDLSLVLSDSENYTPLLRREAMLYDIPLFLDEKTNVSLNPLIQWIENLMELCVSGFTSPSFLSLIKTGLTNLTGEECDLLENEVIRGNWMGKKRVLSELTRLGTDPDPAAPEDMKREPSPAYLFLAKELDELSQNFAGNAENMTGALKKITEDHGIEEKLLSGAALLTRTGQTQKAMVFEKIYEAVFEVMDQLTSVLSTIPIAKEEYASMLKLGMSELKLGMLPAALDQVTVADFGRSRLPKVKVLFILGLNGGSFPRAAGSGGLLSDAEREKAGRILEMAQGEKEDLMEQYYGLYQMLGKAEDKIYLFSSLTGLKGEALGRSPIWKRTEKVLGEGRYDLDLEKITLPLPYMYEAERESLAEDPVLPLLKESLQKEGIFAPEGKENAFLSKMEEGYDWHEEESQLSDVVSRRLMDPSQRMLSITQLEQYARCPYAYFLSYGLKLKDRERPEIRQLEDGTVLHELLYDAGEYLSKVLSDEEALEIAQEQAQKKQDKFDVYQTSGRFQYYWQKLQKTAARSLKIISEQTALSEFSHAAFEWSFGRPGKEEIRIPLSDGTSVRLMGKVDRVDVFDDEKEKYVTIIDYKSGSTKFDEDQIYAGIQIQLPVYMEASRRHFDAQPAGYFYFHLIPQLQNEDEKKAIEENDIVKESLTLNRLDGAFLDDLTLMEHLDKGFQSGPRGLVIKGKVNKDGSFDAKSKALSKEQFDTIETFVNQKISRLASKIKEGKIEKSPLDMGISHPCSFCDYKHACPYDRERPGSRIRTMEKLGTDEFYERIEKETAPGGSIE